MTIALGNIVEDAPSEDEAAESNSTESLEEGTPTRAVTVTVTVTINRLSGFDWGSRRGWGDRRLGLTLWS